MRVGSTRPLDAESESESYGVEMDVIARGADQSRTRLDLLVEDGRVEESFLVIRDSNRALLLQRGRRAAGTACSRPPTSIPRTFHGHGSRDHWI